MTSLIYLDDFIKRVKVSSILKGKLKKQKKKKKKNKKKLDPDLSA